MNTNSITLAPSTKRSRRLAAKKINNKRDYQNNPVIQASRVIIGDLDSETQPANSGNIINATMANPTRTSVSTPSEVDQSGTRAVRSPRVDRARGPTPCELSLEDQIKELKSQNEELERQKASRLLEDELYHLKLRNLELTKQISREDQANQEIMRSSQEKHRDDIRQSFSTSVRQPSIYRETPQFTASPRYTSPTLQQALYHEEQYEGVQALRLGDERLRWLRNFKFDIEDAKAQFLYFEKRMADHGIYDEADKYFVLREYWPNNDMSAYILCTEPRDRNFKSLRAYLMHKDGALPRALLPKKEFHNISGCDLNNEVSKWLIDLENKEILHKFLFLHLIPKHLKTRISSSLSLGLQEFKRFVMDVCDADIRNSRDAAREVRYFNKPRRSQQFLNQRRNEQSTRQFGQRQTGDSFNNAHHQNSGYRQHRSQVDNRLCYLHKMHGPSARGCDNPDTCPMGYVTAPYQQKNGHPSSFQ